jgi:hypothetical protein
LCHHNTVKRNRFIVFNDAASFFINYHWIAQPG